MGTKILIAALLVGIFALTGCDSNQTPQTDKISNSVNSEKNPFEGNWDLISRTVKIGEQVMGNMVKDKDNFGMKLIHDGYWMFTGQETNNNGKYQFYGYSTYTFKDNILTEHILYHSVPANIGESFPWETTVEGDKLILKGPVKIGNYIDAPLEITETYIRK